MATQHTNTATAQVDLHTLQAIQDVQHDTRRLVRGLATACAASVVAATPAQLAKWQELHAKVRAAIECYVA